MANIPVFKAFQSPILCLLVTACICGSCKKEQQFVGIDLPYNEIEITTDSFVKAAGSKNNQVEHWKSLLPTSKTEVIVEHEYFVLSYQEELEQAEWVAYELKRENVVNRDYKRPFFIQDEKVVTSSADWKNYKNSNYDKGHLCPAADMEFDFNAYKSTFLTSNISPQEPDFNGGIWNELEQNVRAWAKEYDGVFVVTAGVLHSGLKTIGRENVAVPDYFYKIIYAKNAQKPKMIAFMIPNRASQLPLQEYIVSVDAIEKITGIDFFSALVDSMESKLESRATSDSWRFLDNKNY